MLSTKLFRSTFLVFAFLVVSPALCADQTGVNGGVLAMQLPDGATTANFNDENQLIIGNYAIVAIPVEAEAKTHKLKLSFNDGSSTAIDFEVITKEYEEQHIIIDDQKLVIPDEETLKRRQQEAAMMQKAYARRSPAVDDILPITLPVEGPENRCFWYEAILQQRNTQ